MVSQCFLSLFSDQIFWVPFLCQTLCKAVKMLPRELRHDFYSRRGRLALSTCKCRDRAMSSPLGNTAVVRDEAWPWFWNMRRCFQTELKDILGGEKSTGQRHGADKPHHSENLLSVNDCAYSPRIGRPRKRQRRICRWVGRLKEFCIAGTDSNWWRF